MFKLSQQKIVGSQAELASLPQGKLLINTVNAHSYNVAQYDDLFADALSKGNVLIPDGASIVMACKLLNMSNRPKERVAGWDLFEYEMQSLEKRAQDRQQMLRVMFMGSSEKVLSLIRKRALEVYPHLNVVTYSPPYKAVFSNEENTQIIQAINDANPDLLWIGMTAPKQEKWTFENWDKLQISCHVGTVGAVFDFFAGTYQRAPLWWQKHSLEWLYRLLKEPQRMWKRYLIGNPLFVFNILKEKFNV